MMKWDLDFPLLHLWRKWLSWIFIQCNNAQTPSPLMYSDNSRRERTHSGKISIEKSTSPPEKPTRVNWIRKLCCSGFCIDLLSCFSASIGYRFELSRVSDAKLVTIHNGKWNGLIAELMNRKVDVALASLMISSKREAVVVFSIQYMDSGVAVLTAKRTGVISAKAFLGRN